MTHTPTPWEAQDFCDGDEGFAIIGSNLGGLVAYASMQPYDLENQDTRKAEANAAFIVKAVNAHDKLVEALRLCRAIVRLQNGNLHEDINEILRKADAALEGLE